MKNTRFGRLIALLLALLTTFGCVVPIAAADEDSSQSSGTTLKEISETLNAISYAQYMERHPDAVRASKELSIPITGFSAALTTAAVEVRASVTDGNGDSRTNCLYVGDTGRVVWEIDVPESALYALEVEYCSESEKTNSIERILYINDKVPFAEARYLQLTKNWVHGYQEGVSGWYNAAEDIKKQNDNRSDPSVLEGIPFKRDTLGNELRPKTVCTRKWMKQSFYDPNGCYQNPLEFYLEKGKNTIAFESVREDIVISAVRLYPYEPLPTYAELAGQYSSKGYKEGSDEIYIVGEMPSAVAQYTLYPVYDRSSAITEPQHPTKVLLNTIGSGGSSGSNKWSTSGEWIEWEFEITSAGLYTIAPRFRQAEMDGLYVSRRLFIDGKVPCEEANAFRFGYSSDWQIAALGDGNGNAYQFYLEPGVHTIRLEVTLGDMGVIARRVNEMLNSINKSYLEILKLTGAVPDEYRDYGFNRVMPDTIANLLTQSVALREIIDYLEMMNGIKSEYSSTLEQIANLLEKMGTDEDEIAKNVSDLKSYVGSLGTWVANISKQPLEIDYILVQAESKSLPKAVAGFFTNFWHEIKMFFGSFFTDYNSLGGETSVEEQGSVIAWVSTGRDQAQIMRSLIDNKFTPTSNIAVSLKLVAGGTLLPSVLAGAGPDVALDGADPINYAIRGAVLPLNDFDTFDEVVTRFTEAALIPLSLYGKTYALPETQTFSMLFYRKDILADLGLEIPKTWDDMLAMVPVLQFNNMTIGLPNDYTLFMYQRGGELWVDDGMRINLDANTSLEAFEDMCNMFTQYSLPYSYDLANRFKTGEMPIGIAGYTTYNQLILFATEIAGLWEMAPLPGTMDEDGNINNLSMSGSAGIVMMKDAERTDNKENAWRFMDWWVSRDFQVDYANELVAVLGPAGKHATAKRSRSCRGLPRNTRTCTRR